MDENDGCVTVAGYFYSLLKGEEVVFIMESLNLVFVVFVWSVYVC